MFSPVHTTSEGSVKKFLQTLLQAAQAGRQHHSHFMPAHLLSSVRKVGRESEQKTRASFFSASYLLDRREEKANSQLQHSSPHFDGFIGERGKKRKDGSSVFYSLQKTHTQEVCMVEMI